MSKEGLRPLGLLPDGHVLEQLCKKRTGPQGRQTENRSSGGSWQQSYQEAKREVSERDLILVPRFPRILLMRLTELISFHVCGLSQESRGDGPEKGKASSPADLS